MWQAWLSQAGVEVPCAKRGVLAWQAWYSRVSSVVFPCGRHGTFVWQAWYFGVASVVFPRGRHGIWVCQAWYFRMASVVFPCGITTLRHCRSMRRPPLCYRPTRPRRPGRVHTSVLPTAADGHARRYIGFFYLLFICYSFAIPFANSIYIAFFYLLLEFA